MASRGISWVPTEDSGRNLGVRSRGIPRHPARSHAAASREIPPAWDPVGSHGIPHGKPPLVVSREMPPEISCEATGSQMGSRVPRDLLRCHQSLNRDQLGFGDLAAGRQRRSYELLRDHKPSGANRCGSITPTLPRARAPNVWHGRQGALDKSIAQLDRSIQKVLAVGPLPSDVPLRMIAPLPTHLFAWTSQTACRVLTPDAHSRVSCFGSPLQIMRRSTRHR